MMKRNTPFSLSKVLLACILGISGLQVNAQNSSPVDIPNLLVWLRADSLVTLGTGTQVAVWGDGGGTIADDVSQATATARPDLIANAGPLMNNKPVLRFSGTTDELFGGALAGATDSSLSVYVIASSNAVGTNFPGLISMGVPNGGYVMYRVLTNPTQAYTVENGNSSTGRIQGVAGSMPGVHPFRIYSTIKQSGVIHKLYINADSVTSSTTVAARGGFTNGPFRVGKTAGYGTWQGDIAEVIIYNRALTEQQRQVLENYIYNKYAPPVSLGPDITQTANLCPITLRAGNRFVSYLWSNGSTADSIRVTATGDYWVRATNVFGKVTIDTVHVTAAYSGMNVRDTVLCSGNVVNLQPNLAPGTYTYQWSDNSTNAVLTTSSPGVYRVTISDGTCQIVSDTARVSVDSFSTNLSLGPDISTCAGNRITLVSPASGYGAFIFNWQPGNTTDSFAVANAPGDYSVAVTNSNGCIGKDTVNVTIVGSAPAVNFTTNAVCLGQPYAPQNTSASTDASPIATYAWTFGDGNTSAAQFPVHFYAAAGTYSVSLTATTTNGCSSTSTSQLVVKATPVAAFTGAPIACVQNEYLFIDQSVPVPGTTIAQWNWAFGDNLFATTANPTHIYTSPGTYMPMLIVTDNTGCSDTATNTLTVVSSLAAPGAIALVSPANGAIVETSNVNFNWAASAGASRYKLYVDTVPGFSNSLVFTTTATSINVNLSAARKYYWKLHAYNACNDSTISVTNQFTIFSPAFISNLSLWLRGDSGVHVASPLAVNKWDDVSGNNLHATQTVTASMPQLLPGVRLLNNKPAINFEGGTDVLAGQVIPGFGTGSYSIFIITDGADATNAPGSQGIFTAGGSNVFWLFRKAGANEYAINDGATTNQRVIPNSLPITGYPYKMLGVVKNKIVDSISMYVNSVAGLRETNNVTFSTPAYAVGRASASLMGSIAEIVVYQKPLTPAERAQVESYLYNKYAPPVNLGPDITQAYNLCPVTLNTGKRFLNYLWSNGSTADTLVVKQSGTYWVRTTDVFGRLSSDTIVITLPYNGMSFNDTVLCKGNSAVLQPLLTATPYTFSWNTGQSTQPITVSDAGSYVLTIADTNGCFVVADTVFVRIDSFTEVSLLPTDTISCIGNQLKLNDNGYNIISTNWSNADTGQILIIDGPGIYSVTAVDIYQCSVSDTISITVKGTAPTADFSKTDACLGNANVFIDLSAAAPLDNLSQWQWDFGDGNNALTQNTSHVYDANGTYPVTLVVATDSGCTASITKFVDVFSLPSANFTQLAPVCAGSTASVSDISNAPVGSTIVDWKWAVNGAVVSTQQNASVIFPQQGINPLTLIVTTGQGCSDTIVKNIETFPSLLADFEVANVCVGDSSYFRDLTQSFSIISRTWSFGDNASSTLKNPVHKYNNAAVYTVTLTVRNAIGCQANVVKTVTAASKPIAKFGNLAGCEDAFYTPLDSSTSAVEPINAWQWTIGGFAYNTQAPNRYFATPGTYPVKLKVATATGCSDSISKVVTIYPRPVANFTFTPLYGAAPLEVTFANQSTSASTYLWDFGDSDTSTSISPEHTYNDNGTYNVSLTAVSQFGCTNTRIKPYTVLPTDLDFSVDEASVILTPLPDGSSLAQVVVQGSNLSTRIIDHIGFYVSMGGVGVLAEDWTGTLFTGQILLDTFSAKFVVPAGKGDSYICVTAMSVNNGQTELRADNNAQCIGTTEGIQLMGPLPNPALNQSVLGIILPKHGKVTIDIADVMGHYLVTDEELELPEGRSDYNLPVGQMTAGEYFIRISYNDEKVVRKLVIRR